MARKPKNLWKAQRNIHDFTNQIHSTRRSGTRFTNMENTNERLTKENKGLGCHDCRFFQFGCSEYIGKYHSPCKEFKWW